jgi:hypothetical protein
MADEEKEKAEKIAAAKKRVGIPFERIVSKKGRLRRLIRNWLWCFLAFRR